MQRKAIVARWFEVIVYFRKTAEDPSQGRIYHKTTIGFSSTQTLARLKAKGHALSKDLTEVRWFDVDNLPFDAQEAFFVIHPCTILLDQNRKTFGRVVSTRNVRLDRDERYKRKRKTTR